MTTRLYTHANCIPIPLESRSLTAPSSTSSIHCRTAHQHGFPHISVRGYATTPLHHYRATRLPSSRHPARQRGARNGTPQDGHLLLSFLPALFDYATIGLHSYTTAGLHGYRATELWQVAGYLSISSLNAAARESSIESSIVSLACSQIWSSDSWWASSAAVFSSQALVTI